MINRQLVLALPAICVLALMTSQTSQAALVFGSNLIQNPGAEATSGAPTTNTNAMPQMVPNWMTTGNFSVVQYTTIPMSVPRFTDPGPPVRGMNFFAGGISPNPNAPATLAIGDQLQDVSNVSALIDTGMVPFTLSAYLGGYFDQRDNAKLTAIFEDAGLGTLGSFTIGPVLCSDRGDPTCMSSVTGLFPRSAMGFIPLGTRNIDFKLVLTGIDGSQNDGYADNLSFIATDPRGPGTVPEPASIGMLAVGLCGFGLVLRFKNQKVS